LCFLRNATRCQILGYAPNSISAAAPPPDAVFKGPTSGDGVEVKKERIKGNERRERRGKRRGGTRTEERGGKEGAREKCEA